MERDMVNGFGVSEKEYLIQMGKVFGVEQEFRGIGEGEKGESI